MVVESFDGLVNELAVGGRIPAEPEASVAVEAVAVEEGRRVMAAAALLLGALFLVLINSGEEGGVCGFEGSSDHVGQNFAVF